MLSKAFRIKAVFMMPDHFFFSGPDKTGSKEPKPSSKTVPFLALLKEKKIRLGLFFNPDHADCRKIVSEIEKSIMPDIVINCDPVLQDEADEEGPVKPSITEKPQTMAEIMAGAAYELGIPTKQVLLAGNSDFYASYGIKPFKNEGFMTLILVDPAKAKPYLSYTDFHITDLNQAKKIIRYGSPLNQGKLPNDILSDFLYRYHYDHPSLLVKPGIGEDTTAVDISGEDTAILKTDPITFVTKSAGRYAVTINANDIATSGAVPRWFLTTLLFPAGVTPSEIGQVMNDLESICHQNEIVLCGGHTEITDAVTRPVVSGMMVGIVKREDLIDKSRIEPGDLIFITKKVAVEGTAIIATEFEERLSTLGMTAISIERSKNLLNHISIMTEAGIAREINGIKGMHDVTEGGAATAIKELSEACCLGFKIHLDRIPIFPETEQICGLLGINPLGLIGSGSLLIVVKKESAEELVKRIKARGVSITEIGEVTDGPAGVEAFDNGKPAEWPCFEVDELTRLFS